MSHEKTTTTYGVSECEVTTMIGLKKTSKKFKKIKK